MIYSKTSGVMDMKKEGVQIGSRDFWFKIVDFLQQNQALIGSDMAPAPSPWKGPLWRDWPESYVDVICNFAKVRMISIYHQVIRHASGHLIFVANDTVKFLNFIDSCLKIVLDEKII